MPKEMFTFNSTNWPGEKSKQKKEKKKRREEKKTQSPLG